MNVCKSPQPHLKIAFVSDAIYPYHKGGKETRLYESSIRLAERGHDVHVYCMKWWPECQTTKTENGVHLHAICRYHPLYADGRRSITQAITFGLACLRLLVESFDVADVDQIPYFPLFTMKLVCTLKRKPFIATWHEAWGRIYWRAYLGRIGVLGYLIERVSVCLPDRIVSDSAHTTRKIVRDIRLSHPIETVPLGVDVQEIDEVAPAEIHSDILFSGRLLAHKNVDVLIKAVALVREVHPAIRCLIVGEGPEKQRLFELARDLRLEANVTFLDFLEDRTALYGLMKSTAVFVLPSTREGFGLVVIEANACGTPVIVIDHEHNAARDLIRPGQNGLICCLDSRAVAEAIDRLLHDEGIRRTAVRIAHMYDWDHIATDLERIYIS